MDPLIGGALIGAGANLLGGLLGRNSAKNQTAQQIAQQKEFAQNGIQWKVADAKAAGIHPLYALGANTAQFSPISISDPMPEALSRMGQDVSRAMYATADAGTRVDSKVEALRLENMGLQNELLRSQIAKLNGQVGPSFPGDGVGVQGFPVRSGDVVTRDLVEVKPSEVTSARSDAPSIEAGPAGPGYKAYDMGPLGSWNVLSPGVASSLDDMELVKYAALVAGNKDRISGWLKNLPPAILYNYLNRPGWVKEVESRTGQRLIPHYRDGKLFWWPTKGR